MTYILARIIPTGNTSSCLLRYLYLLSGGPGFISIPFFTMHKSSTIIKKIRQHSIWNNALLWTLKALKIRPLNLHSHIRAEETDNLLTSKDITHNIDKKIMASNALTLHCFRHENVELKRTPVASMHIRNCSFAMLNFYQVLTIDLNRRARKRPPWSFFFNTFLKKYSRFQTTDAVLQFQEGEH